ncbi:lipopolysaccharide biosynthesis protein [Guptibacillus hwajinpoensis]|uniref:lipopolysaccharide biosynthesis protein n=1 Tax=Guptibacillus hwajinpoensis TaxID=208199 RepID=UPI003D066E95
MNRLKNSIRNILVALIGQGLGVIITLVTRLIFVKYLNVEYLGINALFMNIIAVLSLADLGIATAMVFSLYKPIAENDTKQITILMQLYKKIYSYIGLTVFLIGILILPFLDIFIKGEPGIDNLGFIFFLYVLNAASTYLFTYKRSLIIADQKQYISTIFMYSRIIVVNLFQIFILVYTQNFILYLLVQFVFIFLENWLISHLANRMYPFLRNKTKEKLDEYTLGNIKKNIKAMMIHRIGSIVVFNTDNIILSSYIGISIVGLYSNYLLIINTVNNLIGQIFSSITASIGNLGVLEEGKVLNDRFSTANFVGFWIFGFSSICFYILLNPFINLWIGEKYTFDMLVVLVISINFYINGMRQATLTFRTALGLFWYDRYKPIYETIVNLVASIVLVQYLGILGVIIGTIMSTLFICTWLEPFILYKYGFKSNLKEYFLKYLIYTMVLILAALLTILIVSFINFFGVLGFVIRLLICIFIPNAIFLIFFYKTNEFKSLVDILIRIKSNSNFSKR